MSEGAPRCSGCSKLIEGNILTDRKGESWHVECFVCNRCKAPIDNQYFEHENAPVCPNCWKKINEIICFNCKQEIDGEYLTYDDQIYHFKCFNCANCTKELRDEFSKKDGKKYCFGCLEILVEKCYECKKPIMDPGISARDRFYHKNCFKCSTCSLSIDSNSKFFLKDQKVLCSSCGGNSK